jgi:hypothetical protein
VTTTAAEHLRDLARLRRVKDRIDREYAEPLDVEALARGEHMSAGRQPTNCADGRQMKPTSRFRITPTMTSRALGMLTAVVLSTAGLAAQAPVPVDTAKLGPQVGAVVPAFSGVDQFGKPRTLASTYGPKGAMLVFFRSADW